MNVWPVQGAKARFSELLDACISGGPQVVSRRAVEAAMLAPILEWRRLQSAARPSLKSLLLMADAPQNFLLPTRSLARRRAVVAL